MRELITQYEWSKRRGVSRQYINRLVKSGKIPSIDGKIDVEVADSILESLQNPIRIKQINDHGNEQKNEPQNDKNLSNLLLKTKIKNEIEKGKILEIEAKLKSGEFVLVEDVKNVFFNIARTVRDNMLNIPDRLSSMVASIADAKQIHAILLTEIRTALEELSKDIM